MFIEKLLEIPFYIYHLEVRIIVLENRKPERLSRIELEENFISTAEQLYVEEENLSFAEIIKSFPLSTQHPMYAELSSDFPAPYILLLHSLNKTVTKSVIMNEGDILSFSFILIGNIASYYSHFLEAIKLMCHQGIGTTSRPVRLLDVFEQSRSNDMNLLYAEGEESNAGLLHPVTLNDYSSIKINDKTLLRIKFETPMGMQYSDKDSVMNLYNTRLNGFPSFYQIIHILSHRLTTLILLYAEPNHIGLAETIKQYRDEFLKKATLPYLKSAKLKLVPSTNDRKTYGYVGEIIFEKIPEKFLPLVYYMQYAGTGNNPVYGIEKYRVRKYNPEKRIKK